MKSIIAALLLVSTAAFAAPPLDTVVPSTLIVPNQTGYDALYATERTVLRALALSWAGDPAYGRAVAVRIGPVPHDYETSRAVYVAHVPVTTYVQFPMDGIEIGIGSYVWVEVVDWVTADVVAVAPSYQLVLYTDTELNLQMYSLRPPRPRL